MRGAWALAALSGLEEFGSRHPARRGDSGPNVLGLLDAFHPNVVRRVQARAAYPNQSEIGLYSTQ